MPPRCQEWPPYASPSRLIHTAAVSLRRMLAFARVQHRFRLTVESEPELPLEERRNGVTLTRWLHEELRCAKKDI